MKKQTTKEKKLAAIWITKAHMLPESENLQECGGASDVYFRCVLLGLLTGDCKPSGGVALLTT